MKHQNQMNQGYSKRKQNDYSVDFKIMVVRDFENGFLTGAEIARKYGIQSHSTVTRWVNEYGQNSIYFRLKVKQIENENKYLRRQVEIFNHYNKR